MYPEWNSEYTHASAKKESRMLPLVSTEGFSSFVLKKVAGSVQGVFVRPKTTRSMR